MRKILSSTFTYDSNKIEIFSTENSKDDVYTQSNMKDLGISQARF